MTEVPTTTYDPKKLTDDHLMRRAAGLSGVVGGLMFFAGDMLMYGHLGPAADFATGAVTAVREEPLGQLFIGGLVGPLAAIFCAIGFWHIYRNMDPGLVRRAVFGLGTASMAMLGAVHVLWVAKGLLKRECVAASGACATLANQINDYWNVAYYLGVGPAYLACALLVLAIFTGSTAYPRWTTIFNPAVSLLVSPLLVYVPSPLGAPLVGGDANLFTALYFLVSVLTTWNSQPKKSS
jgi:hypothetical protein